MFEIKYVYILIGSQYLVSCCQVIYDNSLVRKIDKRGLQLNVK
jgi:hypothetical protein